jgi:hypothetical protein
MGRLLLAMTAAWVLAGCGSSVTTIVIHDTGPSSVPTVEPSNAPPSGAPGNTVDITGTWDGQTDISGLGHLTVQTIFQSDGTYSQITQASGVNGPATYAVRYTGDYKVDSALGVIELSNMKSDPTEQCLAPSGCHPILSATSETDNFTIDGAGDLTISNSACGQTCTITYTKE